MRESHVFGVFEKLSMGLVFVFDCAQSVLVDGSFREKERERRREKSLFWSLELRGKIVSSLGEGDCLRNAISMLMLG